MKFPVSILLILPLVSAWSYDDTSSWSNTYPTCGGLYQSPISISSGDITPTDLPAIKFENYEEPFSSLLILTNNGHTIEFELPETVSGAKPTISGGILNGNYTAEAVHFHWGSSQQKGSEHEIEGRRYDLEMHIVHKNTKYANTTEAREFKDGLAVIGVFFESVSKSYSNLPGLNVLIETLSDLTEFSSTALTNDAINLGSLLGNINREDFLTYRGSLTTPPCSEAVSWIIFPQALRIPTNAISKFWSTLDAKSSPLVNNYRPIQPTRNRPVYRPSVSVIGKLTNWGKNLVGKLIGK